MQKYVVADWRANVERLQQADILGCAWQESVDFPHFCGNFWAARCDWLARLSPPQDYRLSRPDFNWAGAHSWCNRMYVETWLGSAGWHHVHECVVKSFPLWSDHAYRIDAGVSGFDYSRRFLETTPSEPSLLELQDLQHRWDSAGLGRETNCEEMGFLRTAIEKINADRVPGVVLECGSFTGFSSTALSLICERLVRQLVVADSFQGLPDVGSQSEYQQGQFCCPFDDWQANVSRFGRLDRIDVIQGYYSESLQNWNRPVAVLWMDVDLESSVGDVLDAILPYLSPKALIYSHESEPRYFDANGQINPHHENGVWRAVRLGLGDRKYRARFLWGYLAELEILS